MECWEHGHRWWNGEPIAVDMVIESGMEYSIENAAWRTSGVYYGMENIAWSNGAT